MTDLVRREADAVGQIYRLFPANGSPAQQRNIDDLCVQTRQFVATLVATVPAGPHRDNALKYLHTAITAAVLGITVGSSGGRR